MASKKEHSQRTSPNVPVLTKPLLASCLLMSLWPKQAVWSSLKSMRRGIYKGLSDGRQRGHQGISLPQLEQGFLVDHVFLAQTFWTSTDLLKTNDCRHEMIHTKLKLKLPHLHAFLKPALSTEIEIIQSHQFIRKKHFRGKFYFFFPKGQKYQWWKIPSLKIKY